MNTKDVIANAIEWANSRECNPLKKEDIIILGELLKVRIPQKFDKFEYSNNPNHAKNTILTTGGEKIIFNTLSIIKTKLLRKFDKNRVETRGRKKGFKVNVEQRFNMRKAQQKRVKEEGACSGCEIRPVVQLSKYDGSFIARYDNAKEALAEIGKPKNRNDIGSCCRGFRNRQSAFGFKWMFEDDYNILKDTFDVISVDEISNFITYKYNKK